jgi:hypothetical protein
MRLSDHEQRLLDQASGAELDRERSSAWPQWQPIATAPRHTPLLVWHPGLGMGGWNVMKRDDHGWRETANDGRALKDGYEPSHWTWLPPSPQTTE